MPKISSLSLEITVMLIIKLIIIYILWYCCFSHPIDKTLTSGAISTHLFNSNAGQS